MMIKITSAPQFSSLLVCSFPCSRVAPSKPQISWVEMEPIPSYSDLEHTLQTVQGESMLLYHTSALVQDTIALGFPQSSLQSTVGTAWQLYHGNLHQNS